MTNIFQRVVFFLKKIIRYIRKLFLVKLEDTPEEIEKEIIDQILFKGVNIWVLIFTIIIACIGLNIDSKSAIIGAMIISPIMAPVYGISYGIIRIDQELLRKSFTNFLTIIIISIATSTIYFMLTPLNILSQEIESFSTATIFDIVIAFFGGMAGLLAISRFQGERYLVGVSIATSCIPPLCVAGYGISHLDIYIFLGGIYLFLVNGFFIFLGAFIMSKLLKIPPKNIEKINYRIYFLVLLIAISIPGIWLTIDRIKLQVKEFNTLQYLKNLEKENKFLVLKHQFVTLDTCQLYYLGQIDTNVFSSKQLDLHGLSDVKIITHRIKE